jgi:hypothetical protein
MGLRTDHVFHRRDELLGEAAMRDEYQTDHGDSVWAAESRRLRAGGKGVMSRSRP